jgi:hypothetical protein
LTGFTGFTGFIFLTGLTGFTGLTELPDQEVADAGRNSRENCYFIILTSTLVAE